MACPLLAFISYLIILLPISSFNIYFMLIYLLVFLYLLFVVFIIPFFLFYLYTFLLFISLSCLFYFLINIAFTEEIQHSKEKG